MKPIETLEPAATIETREAIETLKSKSMSFLNKVEFDIDFDFSSASIVHLISTASLCIKVKKLKPVST